MTRSRELQGCLVLSLLALCATVSAGCGKSSEELFLGDRHFEACAGEVPVCSTTASCVLDDQSYAQGSFAQGSTKRIVVRTTTAASIEVAIYFRTEGTPGTDTEISWSEVGCRDRTSAQSGGADVFAEAGPDRVWKRSQQVFTAGDHLVEVFSDAQADYLVRVSVAATQ